MLPMLFSAEIHIPVSMGARNNDYAGLFVMLAEV